MVKNFFHLSVRFSRSNYGFTLLEVMISVAILAIALVALFGSQGRSLSHAAETGFNTVASLLSAGKMAELESGVVALTDSEGDFGDNFAGYTWKVAVDDAEMTDVQSLNSLDRRLKQVKVEVHLAETKYKYTLVQYVRPRK